MTSQTVFRCIGWLLICAVVFVTLGPIRVRPITGEPASLERLVAFAAIGAVFWAAYPKQRLFVLLFVLATVAGLELAQIYVPGRHGRVGDALVKATGALVGAGLAALAGRVNRSKPTA
jgi:hypothetical protein